MVHNWEDYEGLLSEVLDQGDYGICWSVAMTRQLTCLLRMLGLLTSDQELSIQHLLNQLVSFDENGVVVENERIDEVNFHLFGLEQAIDVIKFAGVVNANLCPLDYIPTNTVFNVDVPKYCAGDDVVFHELDEFMSMGGHNPDEFEAELLDALNERPITVAVKWHPSYLAHNGMSLYCPTRADFRDYLHDPDTNEYLCERDECHDVLAVTHGVDENGIHFVRVQDSRGPNFGRQGFRDIALGFELFSCYITMEDAYIRY